jgi:gluconolactonase
MMTRALACAGTALLCISAAFARGARTTPVQDPAPTSLAQIVPPGSEIEKVAGGFRFTEGPVWDPAGFLLFSDIPNDVIHRYDPATNQVTDYRRPSANTNGNTLDPQGRLVCCEHSGRRVSRRERDGTYTTLVDRYEGKRLNSPNDVVFKSDGAMYFTDPPYGLPLQDQDPARELDFNGVYRFKDGRLTLLTRELTRPNGLHFSPDERTLYVANSDPARKIWMAYPVNAGGTLGQGRVFHDATSSQEDGLPDGLKVDRQGNLYCTGPGGVWVFTPDGRHLGTIRSAEVPANCHWGGSDGRTLYMTARTGLYRQRLSIPGIRP